MPKWSDGYLTVNSLKLHYYRTGGGKPQVVINHGAGDDGLCWKRIALELEKDYDVILPDARGHGMSDTGKGDYSTAQRVADLAGLIRELTLDHPVVGGYSLGADAAMHLAADHPGLTRGIFLEDPPIFLPGETFGSGKRAVKMENAGKMMVNFMRVFKFMPRFIGIPLARKMMPGCPDTEIFPWLNSKKMVSSDFMRSMPTMEIDISEPFEVFKQITVPVLLFIGDKEKMSTVSVETAAEAARVNERVQVVHLAGASHDIRRSRFDGYMPALKKFLGDIYHS